MALVTETLLDLLRRQIETHGTVVWYDPGHAYLDLAPSLAPEQVAGAAVHRYEPERGFLWLRRQLEPAWAERSTPPRLLIYAPLAQAEAYQALIEFEVAGVVVQPGQQPPERNTALAAVARRALESIRPPAALDQIVAEVEAGKWSLAELDQEAERSIEQQAGVIKVIFHTGNAAEIGLRFLSDPALDADIQAKQALDSLAGLLSDTLGMPLSAPAGQGLAGLRAHLARQVLVTDLVEALGRDTPQALRTFPVAERLAARQAAAQIAQAWRNRRDLAESYAHWAGRVQAEIGPGSLEVGLDALARVETFAGAEGRLQKEVEAALAQRPAARLVDLAEQRRGGFWSSQQPEAKTRWEVIAAAGRVLLEVARVEGALKGKAWSAAGLVSGYALGDRPWCELDTAQRHLEREFHRFDCDPQQHAALLQLVAQARQRYATVSDHLAELFSRAYQTSQFELPGVLLQADVYKETVAPAAKAGHVAYLLVDALRFEMARELLAVLDPGWSCDLAPAMATPPTVTEIGMAALMPGAEKGLAVKPVTGRLAAVVAGQTLKDRKDRLAHFQVAVGGNAAVAKLDRLAPLSDPHLGKEIKSAPVVLVTATEEIDGLCESNPALARRMLDDVLNQLRRGIKALFSLGVRTVIVCADHGYLFGEKLSSGQAIDPPGGKTSLLKRRVWVGQGGADVPGCLRAPLSAFGLGGELEIVTPWNLSCFKAAGGGVEYFHGGLSLPELVIPVLTVRAGAAPPPAAAGQLTWKLTMGSPTISTRFVSVTVEGSSAELLPVEPPIVRVEVRAGEQAISAPVSASYGFQEATHDVKLEMETAAPPTVAKNTITLLITDTPAVDEVTVHLLDATTGISLARLEHVPFSIAL